MLYTSSAMSDHQMPRLSGRSAEAMGTIVKAGGPSRGERVVWAIMPGGDDLVDLAAGLFVVQIVNFEFARARVGEVAFAPHVSGPAPHSSTPLAVLNNEH